MPLMEPSPFTGIKCLARGSPHLPMYAHANPPRPENKKAVDRELTTSTVEGGATTHEIVPDILRKGGMNAARQVPRAMSSCLGTLHHGMGFDRRRQALANPCRQLDAAGHNITTKDRLSYLLHLLL